MGLTIKWPIFDERPAYISKSADRPRGRGGAEPGQVRINIDLVQTSSDGGIRHCRHPAFTPAPRVRYVVGSNPAASVR
jgi:hypothetical protein